MATERLSFTHIYYTFPTILDVAFGDPGCEAMAERKLDTLRHANKEFSAYDAEFQRYTSHVTWNPSAKRVALTRGLCSKLKDALVMVSDVPSELPEYVFFLQKFEHKI